MVQLTPDPSVISILSEIIKKSKTYWKVLPEAGYTLEDVLSIDIPEENREKSRDFPHRLPEGDSINKASEILGGLANTNCIVYPPKSFMEWHTNSNRLGTRTYYTFAVKPGKFIYKDRETGEIVVDEDQVGWTVRQFDIHRDDPLWHCVWADGVRFSFGFTKPFDK